MTEMKRHNLNRSSTWSTIIVPLFVSAVILCGLAIANGLERFNVLNYHYSANITSKAIFDFAEKNNRWPDADKWCDILSTNENVKWHLTHSKIEQKQCVWAINKYAYETGRNIPEDMVLMFETEPSWNQVGGIEIAKGQIPGIVHVVLGNGDVKIISGNNIRKLRWQVNQVKNLSYNPTPWHIILHVSIAIFALGIVIVFREHLQKHWKLTVGLSLITAVVSIILGALSSLLYMQDLLSEFNPIFLSISGFLIGVCFVPVLGKIQNGLNDENSFISRSIVAGAIAGVFGSTIVHAILMIHCQEPNIIKPLGGAGFGILAGMMLGWGTAEIMQKKYKKQACCNTSTEVEINEINELL